MRGILDMARRKPDPIAESSTVAPSRSAAP